MRNGHTLDIDQFRKGYEAIGRMNGVVDPSDFAEVRKCVDLLDRLAKTPEQFVALSPVIRVFTRAGAKNASKGKNRYETDVPVFHLIREIVGTAEQIKTDQKKRDIAAKFFSGVAGI